MKILLSMLILTLCANTSLAQDKEKQLSSYEEFISNSGSLITKKLHDLGKMKSLYQVPKSQVVEVITNNQSKHYYRLSVETQYSDKSAFIPYNDLSEIKIALNAIIEKSLQNADKSLGYEESYFVTSDGFKIGYYQEKKKQTFFVDLARYQTKDTIYFKDFNQLKSGIEEAVNKINELRS